MKTKVLASLLGILIFLFSLLVSEGAEALTASWYSVASLKKEGTYRYSKGVMANGKTFRDEGYTAASWDYPLGTRLEVSSVETQRRVEVVVTDRTARRFKGKRIDLSKGAFAQIAPLEQGLVEVQIKEL